MVVDTFASMNTTGGIEITSKFDILKSLLFTTIISLWLYWLWSRRHFYRFAFNYPGPFSAPLIGIYSRIKQMKNTLPVFGKLFEEYKRSTLCIWFGLYPFLMTVEPELIKIILSSPNFLNKSEKIYEPLLNLFEGGGLIADPAKKWQHNRKLINPSFNHNVLITFLPIFHKAKNLAITKFDALVDGNEHNIANMLQRIGLGISVETTMGKVLREGDQVDEDLAHKYEFMMDHTMFQCSLALMKLDCIYWLYRPYYKTKMFLKNYVNELTIQKLSNLHKQPNDGIQATTEINDNSIDIKKTPNIFIDRAIQLYQQNKFSLEDIQSESNTLVAASFETSAGGIFSTLVMLAMHPEVQDKLYEEILSVFPEKDFQMEFAHMEQLPYLDMVINETLRLAPSVPLMARDVAKDEQLSKDLILPKGLQILIPIFNLHRQTDIWGPNADKFNPDNFLPENIKTKHPYAYIPFSKGARNCIGWRYALFNMKVMIAGIVRNFKLTTTYKYEDLKFIAHLTLKYLDEPGIRFHRRND